MKAKFVVFNFSLRTWLSLSIGKPVVCFLNAIIIASPSEMQGLLRLVLICGASSVSLP